MRQRAPIVLSSAALVVAVFGSTPVGQAVTAKIPPFAKTSGFARVAGNSAKLNGRRSALSGAPGTILVVGKDGKLPAALGAVGARGPQGERGPQGPAGAGGAGSSSGRPSGAAGGSLAGSYPDPAIGANAVGGAQVTDNSLTGNDIRDATLTGADVVESTFAQVPSAMLGGLGRSGSMSHCDPESKTFVTCASVSMTLPTRTRVLVVAEIAARAEAGANKSSGTCRLGTSSTGGLPGTARDFYVLRGDFTEATDNGVLVGVTPLVGPGVVSVGIDCFQDVVGAIEYRDAAVTAVALSAS
jgi:hypothetical protein